MVLQIPRGVNKPKCLSWTASGRNNGRQQEQGHDNEAGDQMTTVADRIERQAARPAIVRLWEALVPLKSVNSFMNTGAHPDDETSALLARLAKKDGARVSYVCAVRGEGGQNAIGTEAGNDLGTVRSREMEEAARVLDMTLYWLSDRFDHPIYDFGFSKSPDETFAAWGEDRTLERLVRAIRVERPDVVCPTFLDVPGQHGHHRAMTRATIRAFDLAADPDAYPDQIAGGLRPWQVKKLYLPAWSGAGQSYDDTEPPPNATLSVETGDYDPVLGASYAQIAQWSRVRHRTQGMGQWILPGSEPRPLHRLLAVSGMPDIEQSVFDGLPATLRDLAGLVAEDPAAGELDKAQNEIEEALAAFPDQQAVLEHVLAALEAVRLAAANLTDAQADDLMHRLLVKEQQLARAAGEAAGLVVEVECEPSVLGPGDAAVLSVTVFDGLQVLDDEPDVEAALPAAWDRKLKAKQRREGAWHVAFDIRAPEMSGDRCPYRDGFSPLETAEEVHARIRWSAIGTDLEQRAGPEDPVVILPRVSVVPEPAAAIVNLAGDNRLLNVAVTADQLSGPPGAVTIAPTMPAGWRAEPAAASTWLDGPGAAAAAEFSISIPGDVMPGRHELEIEATGTLASRSSVRQFSYPHTGTSYAVWPARLPVLAADIKLPAGLRVGYVDGGADRVGSWLERLDLAVTRLDADALATADLAGFDTIIIGIFAYRTRPDLKAANGRIKTYVEQGGNLVTLYHRPWDGWDPAITPPRFLKIGAPSLRWRVTDQNARVTHLVPDHPVLSAPNPIGADDWAGWVKERGLYFAAEWDGDYVPLVSMADPDEAPLEGAILAGAIGRGRHVHTSLVLHIQLDALVPGAFRLLANMIAPA